eukprot:1873933-Rhodomonas_salina.1
MLHLQRGARECGEQANPYYVTLSRDQVASPLACYARATASAVLTCGMVLRGVLPRHARRPSPGLHLPQPGGPCTPTTLRAQSLLLSMRRSASCCCSLRVCVLALSRALSHRVFVLTRFRTLVLLFRLDLTALLRSLASTKA